MVTASNLLQGDCLMTCEGKLIMKETFKWPLFSDFWLKCRMEESCMKLDSTHLMARKQTERWLQNNCLNFMRLKKANSEEDCHYRWRTKDTIHATQPWNLLLFKKSCWQQTWMIIMMNDIHGVLMTDKPPSKRFLSLLLNIFLAFPSYILTAL